MSAQGALSNSQDMGFMIEDLLSIGALLRGLVSLTVGHYK